MPNIHIITLVIGRAQRGSCRAQLNIGRASALPALYRTTPVLLPTYLPAHSMTTLLLNLTQAENDYFEGDVLINFTTFLKITKSYHQA